MSNIQIFNNPEFGQIRTIDRDGEPWFVGRDVAEALGYSNTKDALMKHVDEEDKQILQRSQIATIENHIPKAALPMNFVPGDIPNRGLTIINESGLYSLVLSSKLPTAKKFKRWVTSEVIPSVRKHGGYLTPEKVEELLINPDAVIQMLTTIKEEREARQAAEAKIEADHPKVLFADAVSASKQSILIGELAKLLKQNGVDIGQQRLFEWLRNRGYLIRRQGTDRNMPTQRAMEMGLFEIKETTISHSDGHISINKTPKVTGKGQVYFINIFLKECGK